MRLVFWNLRHRRRRHLLNVVVIAITTAVLIVFTSVLGQILRETRRAKSAVETRITFESKISGADLAFPPAFERLLREIEGVTDVEAFTVEESGGEGDDNVMLLAVVDSWANRSDRFLPIDAASREAWKNKTPDGVLVSAEAAKQLGLQIGKSVELPTKWGPMQFHVTGIGPNAGGPVFVVHLKYLQEVAKNVGELTFRVYCAPADYSKVAEEAERRLEQAGYYVTVVNETQFILWEIERAAAIPRFFGFLGLFLLITAGLTLANNSAISIRERRTALAALRVIGYSSRRLLWAVMAEVAIIGTLGASIAVVVLKAVFPSGISLTTGNEVFAVTPIGPTEIAIGFAASVLLPAIGALPSAAWTLRTPLATALRDAA